MKQRGGGKFKIALVNLFLEGKDRSNCLGLALLKAYSDAHPEVSGGPEIVIFEGDAAKSPLSLAKRIGKIRPDGIGFYLREANYKVACEVVRELHVVFPAIKVTLGGPETSGRPEDMLRLFAADCVVVGEGERPFAAIAGAWMRGEDAAGIAGLGVLEDGRFKLLPASPVVDLGLLPSPYLNGFYCAKNPPENVAVLETLRGCPHRCSWCTWPNGQEIRLFPIERVGREIKALLAIRRDYAVHVADPDMFAYPERAAKVLALIHKYDPEQLSFWHFNTNLEHMLTPELAKLCNHRGFVLGCGVQSTNNSALHKNHRHYDAFAMARGAMLIKENAPLARVWIQMILGIPGDTYEGFCRSLDDMYRMGFSEVDVFLMQVYPGTEMYEHPERFGILFNKTAPYCLVQSETFPTEELMRARRLFYAIAFLLHEEKTRQYLLSLARRGGSVTSAVMAMHEHIAKKNGKMDKLFDYCDRNMNGYLLPLSTYLYEEIYKLRAAKRIVNKAAAKNSPCS